MPDATDLDRPTPSAAGAHGTTATPRSSRWAARERALLLAACAAVLLAASVPVGDPDLGWQMLHGEHVLATGRLIHDTPDTSLGSPARFWSNDWLGGAIYALAFGWLSFAGVVLVRLGAIAGVLAIVAAAARSAGLQAGAHRVLFVLLFAATTSFRLFVERPYLLAYCCMGGFALLALSAPLTWRRVAALGALQVVWTQIHGSALLGPVIAGCALVGAAAARFWPKRCFIERPGDGVSGPGVLPAAGLLAASVCGLCVGSLGVDVFATQLRAVDEARAVSQLIPEWRPLSFAILTHHLPAVGLGLAAFAIAFAWGTTLAILRARACAPGPLLLVAVMSVLAAGSVRFVPELVISCALPLAMAWRAIADRMGPVRSSAALALLAALAVAQWGYEVATDGIERPALRARRAWYPAAAARVLRDGPRGVIGNSFVFGGYLLHELAPAQVPFVDGRLVSVYPASRAERMRAALRSASALEELTRDAHLVACVVEYPDTVSPRAFDPRRWALVQMDDASATYVRREAAEPSWLGAHELTVLDAVDPFAAVARALQTGRAAELTADLERAEALTDDRFLLAALRVRAAASMGEPAVAAAWRARAMAAFPGREGLRWDGVEPEALLDPR